MTSKVISSSTILMINMQQKFHLTMIKSMIKFSLDHDKILVLRDRTTENTSRQELIWKLVNIAYCLEKELLKTYLYKLFLSQHDFSSSSGPFQFLLSHKGGEPEDRCSQLLAMFDPSLDAK